MLRTAAIWPLLGVALVLNHHPVPTNAADCSRVSQQIGGCPSVSGSIDDDQVNLNGSETNPGSHSGSNPGGSRPGGTDSSERDPGRDDDAAGMQQPSIRDGWGLGRDPFLVTEPVTLADIAHFRPNPEVDNMEPNGWMIVGLDTNFYSTGGVQVHDGELLGRPASVRFTPVAWHWTYGDGQGASTATPGAPWGSQGVAEFDPTPTSHVYRAAGTYAIDLTVDFRAEYRYAGSPWVRIAGILAVPANRLVATAGSAKTVLVERECTVNPAGPGC